MNIYVSLHPFECQPEAKAKAKGESEEEEQL